MERTPVTVHFSGSGLANDIGIDIDIDIDIDSVVVNERRDMVYFWASLPVCVVTFAVNAAAVIVFGRKEKTGINQLIVMDSFANMLTAIVQMVNSVVMATSEHHAIVCILDVGMIFTLTTWNRLVPVVLALCRYLLVLLSTQNS